MPRKSPFNVNLSSEERRALESIARKYTSPYCDVIRAKIILLADEDLSNDVIASRLDTPRQIVSKWRKRFALARLPGLDAQPRGGRKVRFSPQSGELGSHLNIQHSFCIMLIGLNRYAVSGSATSKGLRARGKALCRGTYLRKGVSHDTPSTTHDRGHAGEELLTAYPKLLRATGLAVRTPFQ
jgi:hypothetical protein